MNNLKLEYVLGYDSRPRFGEQPEGLIPNSRVRSKYIRFQFYAKHYGWATMYPLIMEELDVALGNGTPEAPYNVVVATVEGERGPDTSWEMSKSATLDDCRAVDMVHALVRHEIIGEAASRAVYSLFWNALRRDKGLREWFGGHFPDWYDNMKGTLEANDEAGTSGEDREEAEAEEGDDGSLNQLQEERDFRCTREYNRGDRDGSD